MTCFFYLLDKHFIDASSRCSAKEILIAELSHNATYKGMPCTSLVRCQFGIMQLIEDHFSEETCQLLSLIGFCFIKDFTQLIQAILTISV